MTFEFEDEELELEYIYYEDPEICFNCDGEGCFFCEEEDEDDLEHLPWYEMDTWYEEELD